jgi:hypothetical protein
MTQPSLLDLPLPTERLREDKRRLSNKQRVLARLQEGPATTRQLMEVGGTRAPGRVHELRGEGWIVEVEDRGNGLHIYRLTGRKEW